MTKKIKDPHKDNRQRNKNQNIEQNRKHGGTGMARDFTRGDGNRRDGKR